MFTSSCEQLSLKRRLSCFSFKFGINLILKKLLTSIGKIPLRTSNTNIFLLKLNQVISVWRFESKLQRPQLQKHHIWRKDVSAHFARPAYTFCFSFLRIFRVLSRKSAHDANGRFSLFISIKVRAGLIGRQSIHNLHSKRLGTNAS